MAQDYEDLAKDPQVQHNKLFTEITIEGESVMMLKHPVIYDQTAPEIRHLALNPGEDSQAILEEIGLTTSEIRDLEEMGVIHCGIKNNSREACVAL